MLNPDSLKLRVPFHYRKEFWKNLSHAFLKIKKIKSQKKMFVRNGELNGLKTKIKELQKSMLLNKLRQSLQQNLIP